MITGRFLDRIGPEVSEHNRLAEMMATGSQFLLVRAWMLCILTIVVGTILVPQVQAEYANVIQVKAKDNARLKLILEDAPNETTVYIYDSGKPYDRRDDIVLNNKSHLEIIGIGAASGDRVTLRSAGATAILRLIDCDHITVRNIAFEKGSERATNLWCENVQNVTLDNVAQIGEVKGYGFFFSPHIDKTQRPWKYRGSVEHILIDNWYMEDVGMAPPKDANERRALELIYSCEARKGKFYDKRRPKKERFDHSRIAAKLNELGVSTRLDTMWQEPDVKRLLQGRTPAMWGMQFQGAFENRVSDVVIRNGVYKSPHKVIGMNVINIDAILDFKGGNIYLDKDWTVGDNIKIYGNQFHHFGHTGIAFSAYRDIDVYDNEFIAQVGHPLKNNNQAIHVEQSYRFRVNDNKMDGCLKGVDCLKTHQGKVYDNEILNTTATAGIRLMGGDSMAFYGNTINGGPVGLDLRKHFGNTRPKARGITVHGNTVRNVKIGISVLSCDDVEIKDNRIENTESEAVYMKDVHGAKVAGNTLVTASERTLQELISSDSRSAGLEIRDNTLKNKSDP